MGSQDTATETFRLLIRENDWQGVQECICRNDDKQNVNLLSTEVFSFVLHGLINASAPFETIRIVAGKRPQAITLQCKEALMWPTPLHIACAKDAVDVVRLFLTCCDDPRQAVLVRDKLQQTPLHLACRNQASLEVLELLVKTNPEVTDTLAKGWHPLRILHDCYSSKSNPVEHAFVEQIQEDCTVTHIPDSFYSFWRKVQYLILNSNHGQKTGKRVKDDEDCILHHLLKCDGHLENLIVLCARFSPDLLLKMDSHGNLPLHVLLTSERSKRRRLFVLRAFLKLQPGAACIYNSDGVLPLHLGIKLGMGIQDGIDQLLSTNRSALSVKDPLTGLLPFQLAAATGTEDAVDKVFSLLTGQPDLCRPQYAAPLRRDPSGTARAA